MHLYDIPDVSLMLCTCLPLEPGARRTLSLRVELQPYLATEQELHVLRSQLLHADFVVVDSAVNHMRLLLLQHDDPALDAVFDAQARDYARTALANTMAAIGGLPFGCWVPPPIFECQH